MKNSKMEKCPDLKKLVKLTLGDWSGDGHGKTQTHIFLSNKTVKEIQDAYKKTCKKTKIRLDHDSNIGIGAAKWEECEKHTVAGEYEHSEMTKFQMDLLKPFGFDIDKVFNKDVRNGDPDEEGDSVELEDDGNVYLYPNAMRDLFIWFVKVSLPDWEPQEIEIEPINGYWNDNLNGSIGYGTFE